MEVPRWGVKMELQLPAYATATATQDLSYVFNLHHSSRQYWIFDPLSKARDWTWVLVDTSRVCYNWAATGTPSLNFEFRRINISLIYALLFEVSVTLNQMCDIGQGLGREEMSSPRGHWEILNESADSHVPTVAQRDQGGHKFDPQLAQSIKGSDIAEAAV